MNINFNFTNLASRYNLMSQLFGVKKNQSNGLLNPSDVLNAKNRKGLGMQSLLTWCRILTLKRKAGK